jgi:hypothetical protein
MEECLHHQEKKIIRKYYNITQVTYETIEKRRLRYISLWDTG